MEWEAVIGLEVHVQLATQSKIFSAAATAFGAEPNTQASAVDLGLPGVLPVLNKEAVRMAIRFGLATDADILDNSIFERKNYFYPDLPKGYQISQFQRPIVSGGHLDILLDTGVLKRIRITRAHLEEDAGKSLHEDYDGQSGIDLNRAGTALLEVVSEPDMRSAAEAVSYLKTLHGLVRYLDICDGNMQEGSFRCDANVSVRPKGEQKLGTRTEVKNVNSFRFVERAIDYEIERQIDILEQGEQVQQETLLFDSTSSTTRSMRSKEEAMDYRYFPDPDLLPVAIDDAEINSIRASLPELPAAKAERFSQHYALSPLDAKQITTSRELADYYEQVVKHAKCSPKLAANWCLGDLSASLNKGNLDINNSPIGHKGLAELLMRIEDATISSKIAKKVFEIMWKSGFDADKIIHEQGLQQLTDTSAIEVVIDKIIKNNPQQVADYRSGKDKLFGFFVGQVMRETGGKANPQQVNDILKAKLK